MIVDAHAYCFEPADSPRGYASGPARLADARGAVRDMRALLEEVHQNLPSLEALLLPEAEAWRDRRRPRAPLQRRRRTAQRPGRRTRRPQGCRRRRLPR